MKYNDLRDFISKLEQEGELKRIPLEVDPYLEMTEICDRTLRAGGPALLPACGGRWWWMIVQDPMGTPALDPAGLP